MRIRLLALAAILAGGLFLASATASGPASARNTVTAWNANAGEATVAACFLGGFAPQEARMYAMMHVAIHDALNAIDLRSRPYAAAIRAAPGASPDAAIAELRVTFWSRCFGSFGFFPFGGLHQRRYRQRGGGLPRPLSRRFRTGWRRHVASPWDTRLPQRSWL